MRKRGGLILATAITVIAGGLIWWASSSRPPVPVDPVYDGYPLSQWLDHSAFGPVELSSYHYPSVDSNAVPFLVQTLKRNGPLRRAYKGLWARLPFWWQNHMPDPMPRRDVRADSCMLLGRLGAAARPAIPELIRLLRDDEDRFVRLFAAYSLGSIATRDDTAAVEALVMATKDKEKFVREAASETLSIVAPAAARKAGLTNLPPDTNVQTIGHKPS